MFKNVVAKIEKCLLTKKLEKLLKKSDVIPIDEKSRIVFFSDCHRGIGGGADDFAHNQLIYIASLEDYLKKGFTYIELGDGDELWENRNFERIKTTYRTIFELLAKFHKQNRFFFIWGNHNRRWKSPKKTRKQFATIVSGETQQIEPLFSDFKAYESLVLSFKNDEKKKIFLVHGHQGELINDTFWWFGRFIVRKFWKIMQAVFGMPDPTRPAFNYFKQRKADEKFTDWVEKKGIPIVIGHTHQPVFPPKGETPYFNDGSCVHPRCITVVEIENGEIKLVKWFIGRNANNCLCIMKERLAGPRPIVYLFKSS